MEAHATERSQSYRLRERFQEANVHHGQEVRADLPHVRVAVTNPSLPTWFDRLTGSTTARAGDSEVFFCNMGRVRVREVLESGDNRPLPIDVVVDGLDVTGSGTYDIVNALVRLNGSIRVTVDDKTRIVPVARQFTTVSY
jgi:hypothetical protein